MSNAPLTFRILATCAVIACAYHVLGACGVLMRMTIDPSTPSRHVVFAGISIALAWYFLARPLGGLPLFAALTVQQSYSHGRHAWSLWRSAGRVDTISVLTLVVLYSAGIALARDAHARRSADV